MDIQYDLSAAELLRVLGYDQPVGRTFLEEWTQKRQIPLPQVYAEFLELAYQCPLFATANLWTGAAVPRMYYDEIQEYVDDLKAHPDTQPVNSSNPYVPFLQSPRAAWPDLTDNYLLIGSDYGGGEITFGLRREDLEQDDPPMYWHHERDPIAKWREDKQSLSGFLLETLWNVLNCVGYDTAERALEQMGWRMEEYFDPEQGDWVASKAVLRQHGIVYSKLKRYKGDEGGKVFGCYDRDLNVIYAGSLEDGEIDLNAINRVEAEKVLLDIDDYHDPEENA